MKTSIGLDIGTHHVRALALHEGKDGPVVQAHAVATRRNEDGTERSLTTVLAEIQARMSLARPYAVVSSEIDVMPRFIQVAPLPPDRLNRLLRLELAPDEGQSRPAMDALPLASEGDDLVYLGLVADAGAVSLLQAELARIKIQPQTVSWGPIALAAAASHVELADKQLALVVDIGTGGSDVALVGAGRLLACRRLALGGEMFTLALVDAGLTPQRAEKSKIAGDHQRPATSRLSRTDDPIATDSSPNESGLDFSLDDALPEAVAAPGDATIAMATDTLGPQLTRAAETMYSQLATTVAFFKAQLKRKDLAISQVLICGGGAELMGLEEYLGRRFMVPVQRWNPLSGIGGTLPEDPSRWARAYGLALAGMADVPRIDLRPESDLRREQWRRRLIWPFVAAACILVAGVIATIALSSQVERDVQETTMIEQAVKEHKRLTAELAALRTERGALTDDLRSIAARVYAARDLLYTMRALKELTNQHQQLWATKLTTLEIGKEESEITKPSVGTTSSRIDNRVSHSDALINRGGVRIACRVKTDKTKNDTERDAFRRLYRDDLKKWETPDGHALFSEVIDKDSQIFTKSQFVADKIPEDEFTFVLDCRFPETALDGIDTRSPPSEAPHVP